ncbi:GIY-YIG nuclease family protein [Streptomyces anulatus]|uniref:GIY-YIG nuclease family protein n=1 Tax=Streptomyces anulatus TaxID=1892 RepID=UPI00324ACD90
MPKNPGRTALYRLYDSGDVLLYVGIAADPRERWTQHAIDKPWWPEVTRRDVEWVPSRFDAETAEREAIISEKPLHNSQHAIAELSSEEAAALFAEYKVAYETERRLKGPMKQAAARELQQGTTVKALAHATGLTQETFRRIRDANDIPVDPRYQSRAELARARKEALESTGQSGSSA